MKSVETFRRFTGYKERRARFGHFVSACETPTQPKGSEVWKRVFDAHHPQPKIIRPVTES